MPAMALDDDELYDPDDLTVAQSPRHERVRSLLSLAADHLLSEEHEVYSDLNWYPTDGGNAMAPDVMILPAGAVVATPSSSTLIGEPKSYRQDELDGPPPRVVVEIPSGSDSFTGLMGKLFRYQRLGAVVYVVTVDGDDLAAFRLGPSDESLVGWTGRPMPELGGLRVDVVDNEIDVAVADGVHGISAKALMESLVAAETHDAEHRARAERDRAEALARQLEALGVEPEA